MKKIYVVMMLVLSSSAFATEQTVSLKLIGMYCSMCPLTIRTALNMSDGVENVKVTRDPDLAFIKYNDSETTAEKLVNVVKDAGYDAKVISVTQQ